MLTGFLLRKPISIISCFIGLIVLGIYSMTQLPVALLPNIESPEIYIQIENSSFTGWELESKVVTPIRNELTQLSGVVDIESQSIENSTIIKIQFDFSTNINQIYLDVNEKIDYLMSSLPVRIKRPLVVKSNIADLPILYLNVRSKQNKHLELSEFTRKVLTRRLEQLNSIALVDKSGLISNYISIEPDYEKLHSLGLDFSVFKRILQENTGEIRNIKVKNGEFEISLDFKSDLTSLKEIEDISFEWDKRYLSIKDISKVRYNDEKAKGSVFFNAKKSISLGIIIKPNSKIQALKSDINNFITEIEKDYPEIDIEISQDQSKLITESISNLTINLVLSGIIAAIIILLFYQNFILSLLICVTIPGALIISYLGFFVFGISINLISLSGLIIGIGLIVDNSIIVIDNVIGEDNNIHFDSIVDGINQVFKPLLSSTITNAVVFLPIIFIGGLAGALFTEQAISICIGLMISYFMAVILIPVLLILFLKKRKKNSFKKSNLAVLLFNLYQRISKYTFSHRKLFLIITPLLLISLGVVGVLFVKKDKLPKIDYNEMSLKIDWNATINLIENEKRVNHLLNELKPYIIESNVFIGRQQFILDRDMNHSSKEATVYVKFSESQDYQKIKTKIKTIVGENKKSIITFFPPKTIFTELFSEESYDFQIKVADTKKGILTPNELNSIVDFIESKGVSVDFPRFDNALQLNISREKLLVYGVSFSKLIEKLKSLLNEDEIGEINKMDLSIPIYLTFKDFEIFNALNNSFIYNDQSTLIPIKKLISWNWIKSHKFIHGGKSGSYIPINLNIEENKESDVQIMFNNLKKKFPNFQLDEVNNREKVNELIRNLIWVSIITVVLLYLILSIQFNSLMTPLIIMMEIPLTILGTIMILYAFGQSINIMSMIGLIISIGIIINDSILKIDTIEKLKPYHDLNTAILLGSKKRFNSIVITSLTSIGALIPILFNDGGLGSNLQKPLAVAVIGALSIGTLMSLFYIPLIYSVVAKRSFRRN